MLSIIFAVVVVTIVLLPICHWADTIDQRIEARDQRKAAKESAKLSKKHKTNHTYAMQSLKGKHPLAD